MAMRLIATVRDKLRDSVTTVSEVGDSQAYRLTDPDLRRLGVDHAADAQTGLFGQLDQPNDIGRHQPWDECLPDNDEAENRAPPTDSSKCTGPPVNRLRSSGG